jgi:hypothetical protein
LTVTVEDMIQRNKATAKALCVRISWLLGGALALIVLPLAVPYRPHSDSIGAWWDRFGALVTVVALYSQIQVNKLGNLVVPGGMASLQLMNAMRPYGMKHSFLNATSFVAIVLGTLIWGFGDLLLALLCSLRNWLAL